MIRPVGWIRTAHAGRVGAVRIGTGEQAIDLRILCADDRNCRHGAVAAPDVITDGAPPKIWISGDCLMMQRAGRGKRLVSRQQQSRLA